MKKYAVIALAVSGLSNRVFESGDVVTEDQFPEGHAEAYVKSGHMERLEDEPEAADESGLSDDEQAANGDEAADESGLSELVKKTRKKK